MLRSSPTGRFGGGGCLVGGGFYTGLHNLAMSSTIANYIPKDPEVPPLPTEHTLPEEPHSPSPHCDIFHQDMVPESDALKEEPEEDDKDPEEDPADYPADGDDDDDEDETRKSCLPLWKRLHFAAPTPNHEVGEVQQPVLLVQNRTAIEIIINQDKRQKQLEGAYAAGNGDRRPYGGLNLYVPNRPPNVNIGAKQRACFLNVVSTKVHFNKDSPQLKNNNNGVIRLEMPRLSQMCMPWGNAGANPQQLSSRELTDERHHKTKYVTQVSSGSAVKKQDGTFPMCIEYRIEQTDREETAIHPRIDDLIDPDCHSVRVDDTLTQTRSHLVKDWAPPRNPNRILPNYFGSCRLLRRFLEEARSSYINPVEARSFAVHQSRPYLRGKRKDVIAYCEAFKEGIWSCNRAHMGGWGWCLTTLELVALPSEWACTSEVSSKLGFFLYLMRRYAVLSP
ncbi:hypothetical protein Tco_1556481 [Tanacetum coccineum]